MNKNSCEKICTTQRATQSVPAQCRIASDAHAVVLSAWQDVHGFRDIVFVRHEREDERKRVRATEETGIVTRSLALARYGIRYMWPSLCGG